MEQKRTLWIIAAVGVFLLVVLGAALILYSPAAHSTQTVAAIAPVKRPASNGWVSAPAVSADQQHPEDQNTAKTDAPQEQPPSAAPAAEPVARVGDMTVISQNTTVYGLEKKSPAAEQPADGSTTIDLNTLKTAPAAPNTAATEPEPNVKVLVPGTQTAVPAETPSKAAVKKAEPAVKPAAPKVTAAGKPAAEQKAKQPAAAKTVKKQASVTQFWVQAAAFTSKKTADDARATLDSNKIPADVFTYKDNRGRMFYRVRIGPYMTKSEAEYWRTRIAQIPEFAKNESYVTSTLTVQ